MWSKNRKENDVSTRKPINSKMDSPTPRTPVRIGKKIPTTTAKAPTNIRANCFQKLGLGFGFWKLAMSTPSESSECTMLSNVAC